MLSVSNSSLNHGLSLSIRCIARTAKELKNSDALVVVSPEWSGTVPPGLKNFFLGVQLGSGQL